MRRRMKFDGCDNALIRRILRWGKCWAQSLVTDPYFNAPYLAGTCLLRSSLSVNSERQNLLYNHLLRLQMFRFNR